jgi:hypothetical protein
MANAVTIEQYDRAEELAKCRMSYVELMAFETTTFHIVGFPARVKLEDELARYVDWNNSTSNYQYFKPNYFVRGPSVETAFTDDEGQVIGRVSDCVAAMTLRRYGRQMRPISTLLSQMGLFRAIMALQAAAGRPLAVFEIGPGNGYLGAMLVQAGNRYIAFDNAQSLYLWQNRLLIECAADDFVDWVAAEPLPARVLHLPWWRYVELYKHCPVRADVVVSNTNLGEMNYGALRYAARICRQILADSDIATFLYTNIGDPKQNSLATVEGELGAAGFRKVCGDLVQAFVPEGILASPILTGLDKSIPLYNPSGLSRRHSALDILKVTPATLPMDMDFLNFLGTFSLPPREA